MFNTRRAALFAAVWSAAILPAANAAAETLADAIALAYETNPVLEEQRAKQRALDETYVQARTGLRPKVEAAAQVIERAIETNGGPRAVDIDADGVPDIEVSVPAASVGSSSSAASLSVTQPLYTGGRVTSQINASEADVLAGREALRQVEAGVLLSVIQAYVDVRRDQERLRVGRETVAVLERQREEAQWRFEAGEITSTDVALAKARLAAARAGLASAEAGLAISRANYAALVGQNPGELEPEPGLAPLLPDSLEAAFARAEDNNPLLRAAAFSERASRARVALARSQRRPIIGLRGEVGYNAVEVADFGNQFGDYDRQVTSSIGLTMPIFTGGLGNSQVRQAASLNKADRVAIERARRDAVRDVAQAWNVLLGARANLVANEEQVQAARSAYNGTREEALVGLRTTLDLLNVEQELRRAELDVITARRDEYVAAAQVLAAMGDLDAENLTDGVPIYDPADNFDQARKSWGWVPWERAVEVIDRIGAPRVGARPPDSPIANAK
ncbi:MAG TPA: TolC family outer membrane protein [Caulobacteraceae bacterium]